MAEGVVARVPKDVKKDIEFFARQEQTDKSNIIRRLLTNAVKQKKLEYALDEYSKRNISLGRASEIASVPLADFMKVAADRKIPIYYAVESLEADFKAALIKK